MSKTLQSVKAKMKQGNACQCKACQECCTREPGWFLPQEIPVAAMFLRLTEDEFIATYCTKHRTEEVTVLAPTTKPASTVCIFFEGGKCAIHEVKPYECRRVFGCEGHRRHKRIRELIAKQWS